MIQLHHLENSRSHRIVWLLEELGVQYEILRYPRDPETSLAPEALVKVHPLGKSPVITDGANTIAESGAIVEYLVDRYDDGRLKPPSGSQEYLHYTYWLHYAEGTFMPYMVFSLIMSRIDSAPIPFFAKPVARGIVKKVRGSYLGPNIKRNLDYMASCLSDRPWFCGDTMTAADIHMSFPVQAASTNNDLPGDYPVLHRFLRTIEELPAYQRAIEKAGPLNLLPRK